MSTDFNNKFYRPPNFCLECGELFDFEVIQSDKVICQRCGGETKLETIKTHCIETDDLYDSSREWMDNLKNKADKLRVDQKEVRATTKEICPICGYEEMYYRNVQARSADEGSTVFYECVNCHYKFSQNN